MSEQVPRPRLWSQAGNLASSRWQTTFQRPRRQQDPRFLPPCSAYAPNLRALPGDRIAISRGRGGGGSRLPCYVFCICHWENFVQSGPSLFSVGKVSRLEKSNGKAMALNSWHIWIYVEFYIVDFFDIVCLVVIIDVVYLVDVMWESVIFFIS